MKTKVLFWVGYQSPYFNKTTWENKGIGGSEYCVLKLADYLVANEYDVTISGDVLTQNINGVKYITKDDLIHKRGPIGLTNPHDVAVYTHYDVVIATNYIHYFKHLEDASITFDKNYFWMHNDYFYKWHCGNTMSDKDVSGYMKQIDKIIGVSKLHEDILKDKFKALYYDNTTVHTYISHIENAIDNHDYVDRDVVDKIPGRIIWSSSPDRGLDMILENWDDWKAKRPELTLTICSPPYSKDWGNRDYSKLEGVEWIGALNPSKLKDEIDKAEYWVYVSDYVETYCISALEMMKGKVKILTNGSGNIINLVGNGDRGEICDINPDTIIDTLVRDTTDTEFKRTWEDKTNVAYEWVMEQNWYERVIDWVKLIDNK
jgi:hypothetical protein